MIYFSCPACGQEFGVSDERAGKKTACLKCKQRMIIPTPAEVPETSESVGNLSKGQRLSRHVVDRDHKERKPPHRQDRSPLRDYEEAPGRSKGANEKYCSECGTLINVRAEICPICGVRQAHFDFDDQFCYPLRYGAQVHPGDSSDVRNHQLTMFSPGLAIFLHFLTLGIFPFFWYSLMHGRLPKVRQDDPSGGKALGFMFIPIFNIYWMFFSCLRLCRRVSEQRVRHGLPESSLTGLAIARCIMFIIPYVNLLAFLVIEPVFIGLLQSSINEVVAISKPRGGFQV